MSLYKLPNQRNPHLDQKPIFRKISTKTYADVLTNHHSLKHTFDLCVLLLELCSEMKATLQEMSFCQIRLSESHTA